MVPNPRTARGCIRLTGGAVRLLGHWDYSGADGEIRTLAGSLEDYNAAITPRPRKLVPRNRIERLPQPLQGHVQANYTSWALVAGGGIEPPCGEL